jgi:hypothetical protein
VADHLVPLDGCWSLWRWAAVRGTGLPLDLVEAFAQPDLPAEPPGPERDEAAREATAAAMWRALADPTFLAALTWQNLPVVDTWAGRLGEAARRGERPPISHRNERERLISRYAQRYATKNESIGFFGPVAWASLVDAGTDAPLGWSGDLTVRGRTVSFEVWAVDALARAWSADPRAEPHLPVRLDPAASVRDGRLHRPRRRPVPLDATAAALLAAVTGRSGAAYRLSELLDAAARTGTADRGALADRLAQLRADGTLHAGFPVPFDERPEAHLRDQVERLPDPALRAELTGHLDRLDRARERVRRAATDPVGLRAALHELIDVLSAGGGTARREIGPGDLGRTAVYLDCRRDLDVRIGPELLAGLREPLGLLLTGARWLAAQVSEVVEAELVTQYRRLRRRQDAVTLAELQAAATEVLVPGNPTVAEVFADFQLRWAEIVPATGDNPVRLDVAEVRPLVEALFPHQEPGWAAARRHAPDVMLYRDGDDRYGWVLGELHVALNTLESRLFATQADHRQDLVDATAADFPGGRVVPLYPLHATATNSRTYPPPALDPPGRFRYWSFGTDSGHEHGAGSVPATAVLVTECGGELVGTADGWRARVTEFFGEFLTALCVNLFRIRPPVPRAPRVSLGDLVVCRASWAFPAGDVPVPRSRNRDWTYGAVRAWARDAGLPRHVFVHSPREAKPVYVDLVAPALVDNLARLVRAAGDATLTAVEMLPAPDQAWLTDPAGHRYLCEFRVVAVDRPGATPVVVPVDG